MELAITASNGFITIFSSYNYFVFFSFRLDPQLTTTTHLQQGCVRARVLCVKENEQPAYSVLETLQTLILLSVYPENKVLPSEDQAREVQYGV